MRYATIRVEGTLHGAIVTGEHVTRVDAGSAVEAYLQRSHLREQEIYELSQVHFARVSPAPAHVLCVGLNYRSHIEELGQQKPEYPAVFAKFASTLTGPLDDIILPAISERIDGEVELAVVIGRTVQREPIDTVTSAIAGYTVANDLSMRDWQHRSTEALQGKVFDRSTPIGPIMITPDEFDVTDARLSFTVDGECWQTGTTSDLLFTPAELVSYCSQFVTLQPGDLILTGTPGKAPNAGTSLKPGSVLTTTIEGIGSTVNRTADDPLNGSKRWRR
jgi:acylpyruvate hydrolase